MARHENVLVDGSGYGDGTVGFGCRVGTWGFREGGARLCDDAEGRASVQGPLF